jgi:eukaryotic-like serine/threonine-protein kinase
MTDCPVREQFYRLLNDELNDADRETLEEHVDQCGSCSQLLEGLSRPSPQLQTTANTPLTNAQRYRLVRWHAKGGLGEIYIAQDEELERDVALKEMQGIYAVDEERRERFVLEAKITGHLEHPGIVPVYGLGAYPDGRPFYAMRFVGGDTLKEAIRDFHQGDSEVTKSTERHLKFRRLLGRFVVVCNTVSYAHSRGVLHRDLKPDNIILGEYGETLGCDWGLAKIISPSANSSARTGAIAMGPDTGTMGTATGDAVGTPAYMSPEQAAGQIDKIGPASDTYSLGATLYELLTGVPPFRGKDRQEILEMVISGKPRSPDEVKPGIPRDLGAVCLKAMGLHPRERYQSAGELAADIERWLADEPTSARPEPWGDKARRWIGRHRTLVTAGLALLLASGVTMTVANVQIRAANQRESKSKDETRHILDQTVVAFSQLANLKQQSISISEAIKVYEQVLEMVEKGARDNPSDNRYQAEIARLYSSLALSYYAAGQQEKSERAYQRAISLLKRLANDNPTEPEYRKSLAANHTNLGILYGSLARKNLAEQAHRASLDIFAGLISEYPSDPEHKNGLAASYNNLAMLYHTTDQLDKAEQAYLAGLHIRTQLVSDYPSVQPYRGDLAAIYNNLGDLYSTTGRKNQAKRATQTSVEIYEKLVEADQSVIEYALNLGAAVVNLANLIRDDGDVQSSLKWYGKALLRFGEVLKHDDQNAFARSSSREAHEGRALALSRLKRHSEALTDWKAALGFSSAVDHDRLAIARAATLVHMGRHAEATAEVSSIAQKTDAGDDLIYATARVFALAAGKVTRNANMPVNDKDKVRQQYSSRALEFLRNLAKRGYFKNPVNLRHLQKDPDLDSVRKERDFSLFLENVLRR